MGSLTRSIGDHKRFAMAVAMHNVPRVHQLVQVALRQNANPQEIVHRIELAVSGTKHATGYDVRLMHS